MKLGVTILARHRDRNRYVFIEKDKGYDGLLLLPGGGVEEYESLTDAAVREFKEETHLTLDEHHFYTVHEMIQRPGEFVLGGDVTTGKHKILIVFLGNCGGMPKAGSDAKEVVFLTPRDIREYRAQHRFSPITDALLGQVGDLR